MSDVQSLSGNPAKTVATPINNAGPTPTAQTQPVVQQATQLVSVVTPIIPITPQVNTQVVAKISTPVQNKVATPLAGIATPTPSMNIAATAVSVPVVSANNPFIARDLDFENDWLSMLIYGDFGVGKTYLAGSAALVAAYCDILYIALEGGEKGLKQLIKDGKKMGIDVTKKIMVVPVQTYKQYANIYEFLRVHVKLRDAGDIVRLRRLEAQIKGFDVNVLTDAQLAEMIPQPKMIKTVITDSLTEAQKYCMYQLLGIDPLTQKLDAEPDAAQFAEWGRSREMIQFLIRRLRDLPINSIFICGQDIDQDATKKFHYNPLLPGKLAGDSRGLVDVVGYLTTIPQEGGKIVRRMFMVGGTYGNAHVAAKHRFGDSLTTSYIDNPTMQMIHDLDNA